MPSLFSASDHLPVPAGACVVMASVTQGGGLGHPMIHARCTWRCQRGAHEGVAATREGTHGPPRQTMSRRPQRLKFSSMTLQVNKT